ncbi:MAG: hypothetical protein C4289_03890 [Chloroflexota bacterium]
MNTPPSSLIATADAVIIGGSVVGASVAYHLTEAGCRSVIVLERECLQGLGSTGRATGGIRAQFSTPINVCPSLYSLVAIRAFKDATGGDPSYRSYPMAISSWPRRRSRCSRCARWWPYSSAPDWSRCACSARQRYGNSCRSCSPTMWPGPATVPLTASSSRSACSRAIPNGPSSVARRCG